MRKKKEHLRIILTQLLLHNLSIESEGNGYNIRIENSKQIISKLTAKGKIKLNIISKNIEFDLSKKDLSSLDTYFAIIEKYRCILMMLLLKHFTKKKELHVSSLIIISMLFFIAVYFNYKISLFYCFNEMFIFIYY